MENAAKALTMAAAVLVGMLVLSLGVFLYSNFSSSMGRVQGERQQALNNQFNTQFTKYIGTDVTIYDIITVINLAKDNNQSYGLTQADALDEYSYYITVNLNGRRQETKSKEELDQLIVNDLNGIANTSDENLSLKKYDCQVEINPNTELVYLVNFTAR